MRVIVKPLASSLFPSSFFTTKFLLSPPPIIAFSSFPSKTLVAPQTLALLSPRRPMAATPPPAARVRETIDLTAVEARIFDRLLGALRHFGLQSQLRVAGGWVRDKLLGKECYDIDIALDNMVGSEFVDKVQAYLLSIGEKAQGVAVIPSNPDQSKHLETARMRICDVWVDFVNLRCEEYSENSRIPTVQKFGSAEEDAYRRDLTINSLFYNINTSAVEDYTKRGLPDLKCGRIVTPLPPKSTFMDDPLRVLRAIRFGARFEFVLDEELKDAAACDEVKTALAAKISRERIGTEIDLMISGNQPVKAMYYISDLSLFGIVFNLPSDTEPPIPEGWDRLCVAYLEASWNLVQLVDSSFSSEQKRLSLYTSMFLPLRKMTYKDHKSKKFPVVNFIFRESLKRKVSDSDTIIKIHDVLDKFVSLLPFLALNKDIQQTDIEWETELFDIPDSAKLRVLTGLLLREIKDFWRVALLMSTFTFKTYSTDDVVSKSFQLEHQKELFRAAENSIVELGLEKVWEVKPLVNGKEIMDILQLTSGGPRVREWQQRLLAWQLAHPRGSKEECLEWLRQTNSKRTKTE